MAGLSEFGYQRHVEQQKLLSRLVCRILKIRPDDPLYETEVDAARHKLQHHHFADTNPGEVDTCFDSLEERLLEHSQLQKAHVLSVLRRQLDAEQLGSETLEIKHRILSALWNLYQEPLTSSTPTMPAAMEEVEEDQLSDMSAWEDEPDMYKSDSELSDWSPEQAEPPVASASGADEDDAAAIESSSPEQQARLPATFWSTMHRQQELQELECPVNWRDIRCLFSHLAYRQGLMLPHRIPPISHGTTERALALQVLHMLQGSAEPGSAFVWNQGASNFEVAEAIHVGHHSLQSLRSLLQSFAVAGSCARRVHAFVENTREASWRIPELPPFHGLLTVQALAAALADQLTRISERLSAARSKILAVELPAFHDPVLLELHQDLQGVMAQHSLLGQVVDKVRVDAAAGSTPAEQAAAVLTSLYQLLQQRSDKGTFSGNAEATVVLQLFSEALRPMLETMNVWLSQGRLINPTAEFFICRGSDHPPSSPHFWARAFRMQRSTTGVACPSFLRRHAPQVLDAGKAQALLLEMPPDAEGLVGEEGRQAQARMQAWSAWVGSHATRCDLWGNWLASLHCCILQYGSMETSSTAIPTRKHRDQQRSAIAYGFRQALGPPLDDIMPLIHNQDEPFGLCARLDQHTRSMAHQLEPAESPGCDDTATAPQQPQCDDSPEPSPARSYSKQREQDACAYPPFYEPVSLYTTDPTPGKPEAELSRPIDLYSAAAEPTASPDLPPDASLYTSSQPVQHLPSATRDTSDKLSQVHSRPASPPSVLQEEGRDDPLSHQSLSASASSAFPPASPASDTSSSAHPPEHPPGSQHDHLDPFAEPVAELAHRWPLQDADDLERGAEGSEGAWKLEELAALLSQQVAAAGLDSHALSMPCAIDAPEVALQSGSAEELGGSAMEGQVDLYGRLVSSTDQAGTSQAEEPPAAAVAGFFVADDHGPDDWLRRAKTLALPPVRMLAEQCICGPILQQVSSVEAEMLQRLHGPWSMRREMVRLCNLFLLAAPAMHALADALLALGPLQAVPLHRLSALLAAHLPIDLAWHAQQPRHEGELLPDANDVQVQLQPTEDAPAQLHAVAALRSLVQLRMTCSLQWPMTAIVTADSQWHYSRIQTFLLQMRLARKALATLVLHEHPRATAATVRDALSIRLRMLHILSRVQDHTVQRLLAVHLPACLQAMEAATSLQQLKRAQEEFRRGVLLQVLQTLDASPVFGHSALVGMLECAVRLAELMPQLMRGGASVQDELQSIIDAWERHWEDFYRFLGWQSQMTMAMGAVELKRTLFPLRSSE